MNHFARTALAESLANDLSGKNQLSDAPNGVFLAAPRRTGKSTFLQVDLKPVLERQGAVVVYVDLWSDKSRDPADLITAAIRTALLANLSMVGRKALEAGIQEVSVAGALKVNPQQMISTGGMTLNEALQKLRDLAKKPVALIVDEAQHALTSKAGEDAMTALKSARDQMMNQPQGRLMIVMSGSDRDKLLRLVNANGAPFLGSRITTFPPLGEGFVQSIASTIEAAYPTLAPINTPTLIKAFDAFGNRPQFFKTAVSAALDPLSEPRTQRFEETVLAAADHQRLADQAQMESDFLGLPPIQQAVLWRVLDKNTAFKPYDANALAFYQHALNAPITPQQVQNALVALRTDRSLIWKSDRGEYAAEDGTMHDWFDDLVKQKKWPPGGSLKPIAATSRKPKPKKNP